MSIRIHMRTLVLLATASFLLSGCARSIVAGEHETAFADSSETAVLDFWHTLPGRSAVTNAQGLHGVMLFADGSDPTGSYEARVDALKERGWLKSDFDEPANMAMSRGVLAKTLTHAMEIEGGVMMRVTNNSPRYATRELLFLAIMPPGSEQQAISGLDYVGVISKAQDYLMLRAARDAERAAQSEQRDNDKPEVGEAQK